MCFLKNSAAQIDAVEAQSPTVIRAEANSQNRSSLDDTRNAYKQNLKTSAQGLDDFENKNRKTLLGE